MPKPNAAQPSAIDMPRLPMGGSSNSASPHNVIAMNANAAIDMSHEHHWHFWKNSIPVSATSAPP